MGAWDAVKYGWNVAFWVQIEGIPVIFTERGLGLTLPTGYEREDASLIIDDSSEVGSEVDRRRGLGAGLSFGFRLLDTSAVREYLKRPAYNAALTQNETATTATIHVDSTTGWPNAGQFWLGHELITYTGKTATTFTGCVRGVVGQKYAHAQVSAGNLATSSPRWWRGRSVTLYASPINPAGVPSGSLLTTDAVQVWRGRISDGPNRGMGWWDFQADSLERVLDHPLAAKLSGKIIPTATVYLAPTDMVIEYEIIAMDNAKAVLWQYVISFQPFAGMSATAYFSGETLRKRISDTFSAAVAAAGAAAKLLGLVWHPVPGYIAPSGATILPGYAVGIQVAADAAVRWVQHYVEFSSKFGSMVPNQSPAYFATGLPAQELGTDWVSSDNPVQKQAIDAGGVDYITVGLDSGIDAMVPTKGLLRVVPDGLAPFVAYYSQRQFGAAGITFGPLSSPKGPGYGKPYGYTQAQLIGASVEILFADEGNPDGCMLRQLHSSGTGQRSATWDTLNEGQGYGFSSSWVDADSFAAMMGSGGAGQLGLRICPAGASFADIFSGLLALSRMAVVSRVVNDRVVLSCVRTDPGGAEYAASITDADLLSISGDPAEPQARLTPLNRITVKRAPYNVNWSAEGKVSGDDAGDEDTLIFSDIPAVLALGDEGLDATVPCTDNDQLAQYALPLAAVTFASDQAVQAIALSVPPWVSAQVGDLVNLQLTHPALWNYATQSPGYTGIGRVVGRVMELRTLRVKLTVLVNGTIDTKSLAPGAAVTAWGGPANNPTTIDVGLQYLTHFQKSLIQNGWAWVVHYKPGQTESTANRFAISAAANVGGVCRLTLMGGAWAAGTLSTSERSTITVPSTNDSNTWQKAYTHAGDGTIWS